MKNMISSLKNINSKFQENINFFLILVMFLPDYLRYPFFIFLVFYTTCLLIKHKDISIRFIIPFLVFTIILALRSNNMFGVGISFLFLGVVPYVAAIKRGLNSNKYQLIQYYIVWGSLLNFPFNYTNYSPMWFKKIEQTLMGFLNLEGMPNWKLPKYGEGYFRAYSTFDNPNFYAFILLIVVVISVNQIQRYLKLRNYSMSLFFAGALFINAYAMILTGTRSVLVAAVVSIVVMILVQQEWQLLKFIIMIGCLGLAYLILNPSLIPRLLDISSHMGIRTEIWGNALDKIALNPWFGDGFMTYAHRFDTTHAHNIYIESVLSLGLVGSLALVAYSIYSLFSYLNNSDFEYIPFVISLFIGLMTFGVLDFPFYYLQTTYIFIIALIVPRRE